MAKKKGSKKGRKYPGFSEMYATNWKTNQIRKKRRV